MAKKAAIELRKLRFKRRDFEGADDTASIVSQGTYVGATFRIVTSGPASRKSDLVVEAKLSPNGDAVRGAWSALQAFSAHLSASIVELAPPP